MKGEFASSGTNGWPLHLVWGEPPPRPCRYRLTVAPTWNVPGRQYGCTLTRHNTLDHVLTEPVILPPLRERYPVEASR